MTSISFGSFSANNSWSDAVASLEDVPPLEVLNFFFDFFFDLGTHLGKIQIKLCHQYNVVKTTVRREQLKIVKQITNIENRQSERHVTTSLYQNFPYHLVWSSVCLYSVALLISTSNMNI